MNADETAAEELRAREYLAAQARRERARQAQLRALGGDPAARRALAAKFAPVRGLKDRGLTRG